MLSKLLLVVATMMLVACGPCDKNCQNERNAGRVTPMSDPDRYYRVNKLFEHDGCTVYEYFNKGHWEEFFKCGEAK